jgi:DNA-nicking Smr family endonuclease
MAALPPRSQIGAGLLSSSLALCLIAAVGRPAAAHEMKFRNAQVEPVPFAALAGWKDDNHAAAFAAFLKSCSAILQGSKAMRAARPVYDALFKVCARAGAAGPLDREQARAFFEDNFKPVRIMPHGDTQGFFTGYYETEFDGSRYPSDEYTVPLYAAPADAVKRRKSKVFANFDRTKIEDGAIAGKGLEICYVKDPIDAFFAQIQGSARVKLDNGKLLRLNYIASNGQPYTPVGKYLIDRGIVSKEEMSMDKIRDWMETNPDEGKDLRRKNRSFVFFSETDLRHSAHAAAFAGGGQTYPRLRHADLDRCRVADRQREAGYPIPPPAVRAGYRLGHRGRGARRHLFRPRRRDQPHCRAHQAARAVRHAGAQGRSGERRCAGGFQGYSAVHSPSFAAPEGHRSGQCASASRGTAQTEAMSSRDGSRRRVLSYEERVLWTTVTKAVAPLRATARLASDADGEPATEIAKPARPAVGPRKASPPLAPQQPAPPPLAPLTRRMKRGVARGKHAIDGKLDLHGLTQSEAHGALLRFLRNAHARDARLVLVITGKGRGAEPGVLRRHVPQWLGLPEFRSLVVGFEDAHVAHGGEGALYVRLRRARG